MRLIDIVQSPWAITPEMFAEVQGIYARHMRGEKIDVSAIEARIGKPLENTRQMMQVTDNGVAVIPIEGVIAKRANLFMQISGGTSTQIAGQQLAAALADDAVKCIVLAIDSPGGTVDGTQALSDQVFAARGQKPIVAVCDGVCASAAYWIASAADRVLVVGDTTWVGSIGVITTHVDASAQDMQAGVRVTEIKAGKYKQMGSSNAPLGMAEKDAMQAAVDQIYQVFLTSVARNRGADVATVQADMAEGRMFLGAAAIDAGLVDGVATLDQVIAGMADDMMDGPPGEEDDDPMMSAAAQRAGAALEPSNPTNIQENEMDKLTIDKVRADAPDVAAALIAEGTHKGRAIGILEGAEVERNRILAIEALATPGQEKLIATLKADGKTTGPEAAVLILNAVNAAKASRLDAMRSDASGATAAAAALPETEGTAKKIDPMAAARKARAYKASQEALGIEVSDSEAVEHVLKSAEG